MSMVYGVLCMVYVTIVYVVFCKSMYMPSQNVLPATCATNDGPVRECGGGGGETSLPVVAEVRRGIPRVSSGCRSGGGVSMVECHRQRPPPLIARWSG